MLSCATNGFKLPEASFSCHVCIWHHTLSLSLHSLHRFSTFSALCSWGAKWWQWHQTSIRFPFCFTVRNPKLHLWRSRQTPLPDSSWYTGAPKGLLWLETYGMFLHTSFPTSWSYLNNKATISYVKAWYHNVTRQYWRLCTRTCIDRTKYLWHTTAISTCKRSEGCHFSSHVSTFNHSLLRSPSISFLPFRSKAREVL